MEEVIDETMNQMEKATEDMPEADTGENSEGTYSHVFQFCYIQSLFHKIK